MFHSVLKFLDTFLASETRASADARLRAHVAVVCIILAMFLDTTLLLTGSLTSAQGMLVGLFLILFPLSLYLIKKGFPFERLILAMLCLSIVIDMIDILWISKSLLSPAFLFFPGIIAIGCLICHDTAHRLFLLLFMLACHAFCFLFADQIGFKEVYGGPSETMAMLVSFAFIVSFVLIVHVLIYLKLKSMAQKELDQEAEWLLQSAKLAEISSISETMRALMDQPFQGFQRNRRMFSARNAEEPGNPALIARMKRDLEDLVEVSQGFAWIYRAYRHEEICRAPSAVLFKQLQILLSLKVKEEGWTITPKPLGQSIEICGPIPSMMHLLFSIAVQILESPQPDEARSLEMGLKHGESSIEWTFSWPSSLRSSSYSFQQSLGVGRKASAQTLRQEIIHDLAQACQASVHEFDREGSRHLAIQGAWHRLIQTGGT